MPVITFLGDLLAAIALPAALVMLMFGRDRRPYRLAGPFAALVLVTALNYRWALTYATGASSYWLGFRAPGPCVVAVVLATSVFVGKVCQQRSSKAGWCVESHPTILTTLAAGAQSSTRQSHTSTKPEAFMASPAGCSRQLSLVGGSSWSGS